MNVETLYMYTINFFIYLNSSQKLQKNFSQFKNNSLTKRKELKDMFVKRYDTNKETESEKLTSLINQYELEMKEKLKKKMNNVINSKSIDIKESLQESDLKNIISSQKKLENRKSMIMIEDSTSKINPMNLLDYTEEKPNKNKNDNFIESNNVQIKRIRNEINDLKNIINVKIIQMYFNLVFLLFSSLSLINRKIKKGIWYKVKRILKGKK